MQCILIAGAGHLVVGPFENEDDAYSYAINVLDSDSYIVKNIETPISVKNHQLLEQIEIIHDHKTIVEHGAIMPLPWPNISGGL
jgi:hypothetical protein